MLFGEEMSAVEEGFWNAIGELIGNIFIWILEHIWDIIVYIWNLIFS